MSMMDQAKELYELQKKAKKIKDELASIHIESTEGGVMVTINGEQTVISSTVNFDHYGDKKDQIGNDFVVAMNKAIKKSQSIAADKMKDIMGNMGLGGGAPQ